MWEYVNDINVNKCAMCEYINDIKCVENVNVYAYKWVVRIYKWYKWVGNVYDAYKWVGNGNVYVVYVAYEWVEYINGVGVYVA